MQETQAFSIVAERVLNYGPEQELFVSLIHSEDNFWIEVTDRKKCIGRRYFNSKEHGAQFLSLLTTKLGTFKKYESGRVAAIIACGLKWTRETLFYLSVVNRKFRKEEVINILKRYYLSSNESIEEHAVPFMQKCKLVVTVLGRDFPIGQFVGNDFTRTDFKFQFNGNYFNQLK